MTLHPNCRDLTGLLFGRLTVTGLASQNPVRWQCACACGKTKSIGAQELVSGKTKSCGCLRSETTAARKTKHGFLSNDLKRHPVYNTWQALLRRCRNPNSSHFSDYGERGISVCERWLTFSNFVADMFASWKPGLSIERRDVNGNYCPENCHWENRRNQRLNQRRTKIYEYNGEKLALCLFAEKFGIEVKTLHARISRGWSFERALLTAIK